MSVLDTGLGRYFSVAALRALRSVHVGVIGAGGLGSNLALMLARSGIRRMTIADPDSVEPSNLNRQAYFPEDVGASKVAALARHLLLLEPCMQLVLHELAITRANARCLFDACPVVVEAVDLAETKIMLYELFAPDKDLYVTASGLAGFGKEAAMVCRRPRPNVAAVGDFVSAVGPSLPPFAPRVVQAAAMQADAVLDYIVSSVTSLEGHNEKSISED